MKPRFFFLCEIGAASVEYAIALLVVVIFVGAGVFGASGGATQLVENASTVASAVETKSSDAIN